jgi:hypothetical protein
MRAAEPQSRLVLIPYDPREGISLSEATALTGKKVGTIRNWCVQHHLGRRVGGGTWVVSKVALAMHPDGDLKALRAYHSGDRSSDLVGVYFKRVGLRTGEFGGS